jgi:putative tricarboxylic transport membrane protein
MIGGLIESMSTMTGLPLLLIVIGTLIGIVFGAIPGLSGGMLVALSLPLTYGWNPINAIALLVGQYVGSISGGLLSATLLNIPGTPAAMMTTLDAAPMARAGQAEKALQIGIMASFAGGIVSWLALVFLSPLLSQWALKFGPHEYFAMVLVALMLISSLGGDSQVKGLIAAALGMLAGMVGWDRVTGQPRLTFGLEGMDAGFDILAVLVGVFAVSQLLYDLLPPLAESQRFRVAARGLQIPLPRFLGHWPNLLRSSVIGTVVGILPGVGGSIGSIMAYSAQKSLDTDPGKYGTGCEEGIIASETANNATVGGALVPLITMGIPGSIVDVILIAALTLHNIIPGPLLFQNEPQVVYGFMNSLLLSNIAMLAIMLLGIRYLARLIDVPRAWLVPVLLLICVLGTYAVNNSLFDVWVMFGFGLFALWFRWVGIPLAPFVIGLILAPIAEESFRHAMIGSQGDYLTFLRHPIAAALIGIALLVGISPWIRKSSSVKGISQR